MILVILLVISFRAYYTPEEESSLTPHS
ncbi:hypothetical protein KCP69_12465 [Salmonella enterica subsp. enterica]|nr:hypothetical protein KCP69_12465 [Salmonella enterica subsp. enterica]